MMLSRPVNNDPWQALLLPLDLEDIHPLKWRRRVWGVKVVVTDMEDIELVGIQLMKGYKRVNLIFILLPWYLMNLGQPALYIEYCQSCARAMWWSEEVLLLHEEMRRTLAFFKWHAQWWEEWRPLRTRLSDEEREGLVAYTSKQAYVWRSMQTRFEHMWHSSDELIQPPSDE